MFSITQMESSSELLAALHLILQQHLHVWRHTILVKIGSSSEKYGNIKLLNSLSCREKNVFLLVSYGFFDGRYNNLNVGLVCKVIF